MRRHASWPLFTCVFIAGRPASGFWRLAWGPAAVMRQAFSLWARIELNGTLQTTIDAPGPAASLHKVQNAWLAHRTAACNLQTGGLAGYSTRPMVNLSCISRMTKFRMAELVKLAT